MSRHKSLLARFGKQRRHPVRTMTARLEQLEPRIVLAGEPFAVNDVYIIPPNTTLAVDANAGLLINDRDPDQPSYRTGLTVATEWVTPPQVGSLNAYAADGSFEYQPAQDFVGLDTFTYKNTDERQNLTITPPLLAITAIHYGTRPTRIRDRRSTFCVPVDRLVRTHRSTVIASIACSPARDA